MPAFNNYSGYTQLFRDGFIGLLLSSGIFGTLLPNLIESIGYTNNLASFSVLNIFSVVYFLVPIFICTTYWLVRGYRLYLTEKVPGYNAFADKLPPNKNRTTNLLLLLLKSLPVILFFYKNSLLTGVYGIIMIAFYLTLVALQGLNVMKSGGEDLDWLVENKHVDDNKNQLMRDGLLRITILIFALDFLVGLALIIFSQPWILYSNFFYPSFVLTLLIYVLCFKSYAYQRIKNSNMRVDMATVGITICAVALLFPSVNLHMIYFLPGVVAVMGIIAMTTAHVLKWEHRRFGFSMLNLIYFLVFIVVFYLFIIPIYHKNNIFYLKNRLEAARQLSTNELFPFVIYQVNQGRYAKLDVARKVKLTEQIRDLNFSLLLAGDNYSKMFNGKQTSRKLLDTYNVRITYYAKYDELIKQLEKRGQNESEQLAQQFQITTAMDDFYNGLNQYVDNTLYPNFYEPAQEDRLESLDHQFHHFFHPLDYVDLHFEYCQSTFLETKKQMEVAQLQLKLQKDRSAKGKIQFDSKVDSVNWSVVKGNNFSDKSLRQFVGGVFEANHDTMSIQRIVDLYSFIHRQASSQLDQCLESTRKVFRSYLVDSQRIGVYIFLVTVLVLTMAASYNRNDNNAFGNADEEQGTPWDSPRKLLFIQVVAIALLLVPLVKPIAPEDIDPRKPYWMINIGGLHLPTSISELTGHE